VLVTAEQTLISLDAMLVAELATLVSTVRAPWLKRRLFGPLIAVVVLVRLDLESLSRVAAGSWGPASKPKSKSNQLVSAAGF
jgi:hypothetical protein